jgi:hypothetical protein
MSFLSTIIPQLRIIFNIGSIIRKVPKPFLLNSSNIIFLWKFEKNHKKMYSNLTFIRRAFGISRAKK